MAQKKGFGWHIPTDWDEEDDGFLCYVMCVPNSQMWRAVFDGHISALAYGRNWDRATGTITEVQSQAREVFESMCAAKCDDVLEQLILIATGIVELGDKTGVVGQAVDAPLNDGVIETGEGQQFPDQASYFVGKCNVANGIYDTVLGIVTWLRNNNVDLLAGVFGGVTSGLLLGVALAGPVGWAVALAGSIIVGLAGFLISTAVDFEDLQNALIDVHDECVLALFNASDAIVAEQEFIAAVEASTVPISPVESQLLQLIVSSEMVNQLFAPREDVATYQSASPIDCGTALLAFWTFPSDAEGWVFRDDSAGASTASGAYNGSDETLEITMNNAGGGSKPISKGTWLKTGLAVAVPAGSSLQFDYSAPSDSINQSKHAKIIYSDLSEDNKTVTGGTTAGTLVMTLPVAKTIEEIELSISRTTSSTNSHISDIEEVRVFGT